jgi:hypothetical protein
MYSAKISSGMTINRKTGEVKVNEFKVSVDGFSEPKLLEKAKESYNSNKNLPKFSYPTKWPEGNWCELYRDMWENFLRWRRRKYK